MIFRFRGTLRNDFPALSLAALTTPSLPWISLTTIARFYFPLFCSWPWIRMTSPVLISGSPFWWLRLCLSQRLLMYSLDHQVHITSFQQGRYLACFLKSLLSIASGLFSGNWFTLVRYHGISSHCYGMVTWPMLNCGPRDDLPENILWFDGWIRTSLGWFKQTFFTGCWINYSR